MLWRTSIGRNIFTFHFLLYTLITVVIKLNIIPLMLIWFSIPPDPIKSTLLIFNSWRNQQLHQQRPQHNTMDADDEAVNFSSYGADHTIPDDSDKATGFPSTALKVCGAPPCLGSDNLQLLAAPEPLHQRAASTIP